MFDITNLVFGYNLLDLPDLSIPFPDKNILEYIVDQDFIESIENDDGFHYYFGIIVEQFDFSCNFFTSYDEYVTLVNKNRKDYIKEI